MNEPTSSSDDSEFTFRSPIYHEECYTTEVPKQSFAEFTFRSPIYHEVCYTTEVPKQSFADDLLLFSFRNPITYDIYLSTEVPKQSLACNISASPVIQMDEDEPTIHSRKRKAGLEVDARKMKKENRSNIEPPSFQDITEEFYEKDSKTFVNQLLETVQKYTHDIDNNYLNWKVLAGFIMKNVSKKSSDVVCFSTGTKGMNEKNLDTTGTKVYDSHAEIISRRCLKDFFYKNLQLLLDGKKEESIFIDKKDGRFCLKPNLEFYLYISTAPCGDGRVFCHSLAENEVDKYPHNPSRGQLRVKNYGGKATKPIKDTKYNVDWNRIVLGQEKLVNMSCSDKICSWNVLGLQGALLSHFIEPVYMQGIILGDLFNAGHLKRAIFGRIEDRVSNLPPLYKINQPKMVAVKNEEIQQKINSIDKTTVISLNWTKGEIKPEILHSKTGRTITGQVSRLSKYKFFQCFRNLCNQIPTTEVHTAPTPPLYGDFKTTAKSYNIVKKILEEAFQSAGLGGWVKKPAEQLKFEVS